MVMIGSSGSIVFRIRTASPFRNDGEMLCLYVASSVSRLPLSYHRLRIPITRIGMASFYSVEAIHTNDRRSGRQNGRGDENDKGCCSLRIQPGCVYFYTASASTCFTSFASSESRGSTWQASGAKDRMTCWAT